MVTIEVKKEMFARIKLPELEIEARVVISPKGEVDLSFMPWTHYSLSGESFEQLVEDYNILKAQIKLCVENQGKEKMAAPGRGYRVK